MKKGILLFLLLLPLITNSYALTNITNCQNLTSSDVYNLTQNVSTTLTTCFEFQNNDIILDCNNYKINYEGGSGVLVKNYNNATIINCEVEQNGTGTSQAIETQNITNSLITNNTIITVSSNSRGIRLFETENVNVSYNTVTTTGTSANGIYLLQFNSGQQNFNNWIGYNTVNVTDSSASAIYSFEVTSWSGIYQKNVYIGNIIVNDNPVSPAYPFDLTGHNNHTEIINSIIPQYWFGGGVTGYGDIVLSIENTSYGLINWTSPLNADGQNRHLVGLPTSDVVFGDNYVFVNSSSDLNTVANVTLYNIGDRGFIQPVILKDGEICSDCVNYTNLDATNVLFSVTGFSNYSIGDNGTAIQLTVYSPENTTYQSSTATAIVTINISVNDTLNTAWYEYDTNGTNITFSPNSSIIVDEGSHNLTIYVNNTYGYEDFEIIYFTYEQVIPAPTGAFGFDVEGATEEIRDVFYVIVPILLVLVIFVVYRDWFKEIFNGIIKRFN